MISFVMLLVSMSLQAVLIIGVVFGIRKQRRRDACVYWKMKITMIEQYVADNQLDIRYYHAYGWDPVELFTED